jgi:hypothetical protein
MKSKRYNAYKLFELVTSLYTYETHAFSVCYTSKIYSFLLPEAIPTIHVARRRKRRDACIYSWDLIQLSKYHARLSLATYFVLQYDVVFSINSLRASNLLLKLIILREFFLYNYNLYCELIKELTSCANKE